MKRCLIILPVLFILLCLLISPALAEIYQTADGQCMHYQAMDVSGLQGIIRWFIKALETIFYAVIRFICGGLNAFGINC